MRIHCVEHTAYRIGSRRQRWWHAEGEEPTLNTRLDRGGRKRLEAGSARLFQEDSCDRCVWKKAFPNTSPLPSRSAEQPASYFGMPCPCNMPAASVCPMPIDLPVP